MTTKGPGAAVNGPGRGRNLVGGSDVNDISTCHSGDGCATPVYAHDLCRKHYDRWRRSGVLGTCEAPGGCPKPVHARHLCAMHLSRWKRTPELYPELAPVAISVGEEIRTRTSKVCPTCGTVKPLGEFQCNALKPDGRDAQCAACKGNRALLSRYGLTPEAYEEMLESQGGGCAICGKTPEENGRRLAVDHDHTCCPRRDGCCGKCVRGLLCNACNIHAVPYAERRSTPVALAAAQYVGTTSSPRTAMRLATRVPVPRR